MNTISVDTFELGISSSKHLNQRNLSRHALAAELFISQRDLRNLLVDTSLIEPRPSCLIVSMGTLNCLITESVLLVVRDTSAETQRFINTEFSKMYTQACSLERGSALDQQFELKALESIFLFYTSSLLTRFKETKTRWERSIKNSTQSPSQELMALSRKHLQEVNTDVDRGIETIMECLDEERDVQRLSLANARLEHAQEEPPVDPDEIEELLEMYMFELRALKREVNELLTSISHQIDAIQLNLDQSRNTLGLMDNKISIVSLAVTVITCIGSMMGMNVFNPWNYPSPPGPRVEEVESFSYFINISIFMLTFGAAITLVLLIMLRVTMKS
eukprot:gnl/Dysnectes_brevis/7486_a12590_329.p1 GENE.gnl/Dysnectes_brevis/7486_a12590_329~~gnl/Dysnectes_brevis/7486_a12590_329.p1  ORF type:complete len:332 (+),score=44.46 gnl/Dysnectes_brevis/7486_a12590_329:108-1103(+)